MDQNAIIQEHNRRYQEVVYANMEHNVHNHPWWNQGTYSGVPTSGCFGDVPSVDGVEEVSRGLKRHLMAAGSLHPIPGKQLPSSSVAEGLKLRASGSVQPEITNSSQLPSSVLAHLKASFRCEFLSKMARLRPIEVGGQRVGAPARAHADAAVAAPEENGEGVEVLGRRVRTAHALARPVVDGGGRVVVERLGVGAPRQFVSLARPVVRVGERVVVGGVGVSASGHRLRVSHKLKSPNPKIWANGSKLLAAGSETPPPNTCRRPPSRLGCSSRHPGWCTRGCPFGRKSTGRRPSRPG